MVALAGLVAAANEPPVDGNTVQAVEFFDAAPVEEAAAAFPLIGWWGPPPSGANLSIYRQAFLNWAPIALRRTRADTLDDAQEQNLKVVLDLPANTPLQLERIPDAVRDHPAVVACIVAEGVTGETAGEAVRRVEVLREWMPDWVPVATIVASPDDPAWEAAAASLAAAGAPVLPWILPFAEDGTTDESGLYGVLRAAADAAEHGGVPLWGIVQVTEHTDRRRASESDMRLQAYASLAHGARGLVYYTYWGPPPGRVDEDHPLASFGVSMVDAGRGRPAYGHQMARVINAEITLLSPYLEQLEPLGVYFAGEIPEGGEPLPAGAGPITRVDSARAMVGYFRGPDGADWAMVVNRQHGMLRSARTQGRTMGIVFDDSVTAIHAIERQSGLAIPVPVEDGYFTITLPGGTGNLLRFERGEPDGNGP